MPQSELSFRPVPTIDDEDFLTFFRHIPEGQNISRLFSDSGVVLSLFRSLSDQLKCIVLRLLDLQEPIRWDVVSLWSGYNRQKAFETMSTLRSLRLLTMKKLTNKTNKQQFHKVDSATDSASIPLSDYSNLSQKNSECSSTVSSDVGGSQTIVHYDLNPKFRETLRQTFQENFSLKLTSKQAKHTPTKKELHSHAAGQWKELISWLMQGFSRSAVINSALRRIIKEDEAFLSYKSTSTPHKDVMIVLSKLCLTSTENWQAPAKTESEFHILQWLLRDVRSQLLSLCLEYLRSVEFGLIVSKELSDKQKHSHNYMTTALPISSEIATKQACEVLALILTVGELSIGQPCTVSSLSPAQKRFLHFSYNIGLVWCHKPVDHGVKHFFPTPFAKLLQPKNARTEHLTSVISNLTVLGSAEANCLTSFRLPDKLYHPSYSSENVETLQNVKTADNTKESGVIVETNFKIFVYTSCPFLLYAVVRLCEIRVITPTLLVGILTRETIQEMYKVGVTAEQLIRFFTTHAHPCVYAKAQRENKPILPENVSTQLCIWEQERKRIRTYKSYVMEFVTEQDLDIFPLVVSRAKAYTIMHTPCPSTTEMASEQFNEWKASVLTSMKERASAGSFSTVSAPVLVIHARYKDELTNIVRSIIRSSAKK